MTPTLPDISSTGDHRTAMLRIVVECGFRKGAELGVGSGHLSRLLMENCPDLHLIGVDALRRQDRGEKCKAIASEFPDRYTLLPKRTFDAAGMIEESSLDFVFIDAGHSFGAVHDDIRRWHGKVRPGGWILGHDYGDPRHAGVADAVDQWFGDRVIVLDHTIWAVAADHLARGKAAGFSA